MCCCDLFWKRADTFLSYSVNNYNYSPHSEWKKLLVSLVGRYSPAVCKKYSSFYFYFYHNTQAFLLIFILLSKLKLLWTCCSMMCCQNVKIVEKNCFFFFLQAYSPTTFLQGRRSGDNLIVRVTFLYKWKGNFSV